MTDYLKEVAILGIVVIVSVAVFSGVNGVLLSSAIGGIAGIAGYSLGVERGKQSQEGEGGESREEGEGDAATV